MNLDTSNTGPDYLDIVAGTDADVNPDGNVLADKNYDSRGKCLLDNEYANKSTGENPLYKDGDAFFKLCSELLNKVSNIIPNKK